MKKLLGVLTVVALFVTPLNAFAAVKAGDTCKKAGITSTFAGKKYTCIKSGKKLIWDKGVLVKSPVTKLTPTPDSSSPLPICPKLDSADGSGITQSRANALVGMSEFKAKQCADSLNWGFRVGQRDSEMFAMTRVYRLDRVTIIVMLDVVTRVDVG